MARLYYVHDPMCSWCYGFAGALRSLSRQLPASVKLIRLLGGLAPDTDAPMEAAMQAAIRSNWQRIEQTIPGVRFNHDFWIRCCPRRSTWPACRAVIAAREQGEQFDIMMTEAIQQAYYRQARNPSDESTLLALAAERGLDTTRFQASLNSDRCHRLLRQEIQQARAMGVESYPALRLCNDGGAIFPVAIDYHNADSMLACIQQRLK